MGEIHPDYEICGLDVSKYQSSIDFDKAKEEGVKFIIARSTYGAYDDIRYRQHTSNARLHDVPFGAYHYWRPQNPPKDQARRAKSMIGYNPDMLVWLDCEKNQRVDPWDTTITRKVVSESIYATLEEFDNVFGKETNIYTSAGFWNDWVLSSYYTKMRLSVRNLWVAQWFFSFRKKPYPLPRGFFDYVMWQFSGTQGPYQGKAYQFGVSGSVSIDVNALNIKAVSEFARLFGNREKEIKPNL